MQEPWPDRGGHLWPKDRRATTPDGTVIAYAVRGPRDAPTVLCCSGFLCPDNHWRVLAPALAADHRVVLFDHRGTGASSEDGGGARPRSADGYRMPALVSDAVAVVEAEGIRHALVIGHSMGTQVALELLRERPGTVGALALLAGPARSPLRTLYGTPLATALFPLVSIATPALPRALTRSLLHALELPGAMEVGRAIKALGPATPAEGMAGYRHHLGRVDPRTAIWTARGMHDHDASDLLITIDVPTLVAAGTRDGWLPEPVARDLAARIPDAELLIVDDASHALPIEFPERLLPRLRRLAAGLRRAGDAQ